MALSAGYQLSRGGNISPLSYDHGEWDLSDMCAVATSMETYPIFDLKVIENLKMSDALDSRDSQLLLEYALKHQDIVS